ncbi:ParB/RepB/Spo0J family partition protein [Flavobacteriaceae bacterium]|nr:ParB/RepB/Spo0J family partition protein [Flavobacteriaceae bacterium]
MADKKEQIGEIVRVPTTSIKENPINYQIYSSKHTKEDEDLESSIQLYGQLEPCLVNEKTNQLISGHRRFNVLKKLGVKTIDVIYKSVDELEIIELIQSNRHREKSLVEKINEYRTLKAQMKSLPLKKRKELMGSLKLREYLHKEVGINQSNDARLKIIEDSNDEDLLNSVLSGELSIKSAYRLVKQIGDEGEVKAKLKHDIKNSVVNGRDKLSFHDVVSIVDEVYKRKGK